MFRISNTTTQVIWLANEPLQYGDSDRSSHRGRLDTHQQNLNSTCTGRGMGIGSQRLSQASISVLQYRSTCGCTAVMGVPQRWRQGFFLSTCCVPTRTPFVCVTLGVSSADNSQGLGPTILCAPKSCKIFIQNKIAFML